ncbi:MAG: PAS domain S-box protein [Nitrospirota bacterium]
MKKKIAVVLSVFCLAMLVAGAYIIVAIERSTSSLGDIIEMHQVEIIREHLLIQLITMERDLNVLAPVSTEEIQKTRNDLRIVRSMAHTCTNCHHVPEVKARLDELQARVADFEVPLSRVLTIHGGVHGGTPEWLRQKRVALEKAAGLIEYVKGMTAVSSSNLDDKTNVTMQEIDRTKHLLFGLIMLAPLVTIALSYVFMRGITNPIGLLVQATRRIRGGDLDHEIQGLTDEFGELATSFNEMSVALKENIRQCSESEQRYRTLFETARDAIFVLEAEGGAAGRIVDANPAAAEMHGYAMQELVGSNLLLACADGASAEGMREMLGQIMAGSWARKEFRLLKKDGTPLPVEMSAVRFYLGGQAFVIAFNRDITERKRMENMLLQSKRDWEETFDTITDMVTIQDANCNIVRANRTARTLLSLPPLEGREVKCYEYFPHVEPCCESCPAREKVRDGGSVIEEIYHPAIKKLLELEGIPRFDAGGALVGIIHIARDITVRKRTEEALRRAEQMKMVGETAAGLAHEIKNPLAAIKMAIESLIMDGGVEEEDKEILVRARDEARHIELLIKGLLNFAKPQVPHFTEVQMEKVLSRACRLLTVKNSRVKTSVECPPGLPPIPADPMQLQQAFLNLMLNAIEAMEGQENGTLLLRAHHDQAQGSIVVEIQDSGKGINATMRENIFKPFFTTKSDGTGLGLSITKQIIDQHHGMIRVTDNPEGGSIFVINLPANSNGTVGT